MEQADIERLNRDFLLLINAVNALGGTIPLLNEQVSRLQVTLSNDVMPLFNSYTALKAENEELKKKASELETKLKKQGG